MITFIIIIIIALIVFLFCYFYQLYQHEYDKFINLSVAGRKMYETEKSHRLDRPQFPEV